jgi:hypothetical protein
VSWSLDDTHVVSTRHHRLIVGLTLLTPVAGWAHALSPTYYPLGHVPIYAGIEWWPSFALIPVSVAAAALVLHRWLPAPGLLGNFWRAAILYVVARAGEAGAIFLLQSIPLFRRAGWTSSTAENLGPLLLFLAAGLAVALPAALLVYRRTEPRTGRILVAAVVASLAAYLAALGCCLLIMEIRGY